jgi:DNA-binding NarL/FixJ family response regulator
VLVVSVTVTAACGAGVSMLQQTLQIYVVDAHPVVCEGLARVLSLPGELEVVGFAHSGERALLELPSQRVDLVIIDHDLNGEVTGSQLCGLLTREPYLVTCLGMSAQADGTSVRDFLAAGSRGVLHKQAERARILEGVRAVAAGGIYLDPHLSAIVVRELAPQRSDRRSALTPTEYKVLGHLAKGLSNRQISGLLSVSTSSVKGYVSHLLQKLDVTSRTEAVAVAARTGLLASVPERRHIQ